MNTCPQPSEPRVASPQSLAQREDGAPGKRRPSPRHTIGGLALVAMALLATPAAQAIKEKDFGRDFPNGIWCPFDGIDLRFVATDPRATIEFSVPTLANGDFSQQRLDNIAVVEASVYENHLFTTDQGCIAGGPEAPAFNFNSGAAGLAFLDTFSSAPQANWGAAIDRTARNADGDNATFPLYWHVGSNTDSSPEPSPPGTSGGSLAFGRENDDDLVTATLSLENLSAGTTYVVSGWWYQATKDENTILKIRVEQPETLVAIGETFRVNTTTAGNQRGPAVAMNRQGQTVIAWQHGDPGSSCSRIFAQRFDGSGAESRGGELDVTSENNCDGLPDATTPSVGLGTTANRFVVGWRQDDGDSSIRARRYTYTGASASPATVVDLDNGIGVDTPLVRFDPTSDRYAVAWHQRFFGTLSAFTRFEGQVFPSSGSPSAVFRIGNDEDGDLDWQTGALAATWLEGDDVFGEPYEGKQGLYSATGMPLQATTGVSDSGRVQDVRVAVARITGRYLVVWSATGPSGVRGVWARLFGADGLESTNPVRIDEDSDFDLDTPAVASDGVNFLIAWNDHADPSFIRARLVDGVGQLASGEIVIDDLDGGSTAPPAVAGGAVGNFLVAWEGTITGLDETPTRDILARRIVVVEPLRVGQPLRALADDQLGNLRFFGVTVPEGATSLRLQTSGGTGDADLLARPGLLGDGGNFSFSATNAGNAGVIQINNPTPGDWLIALESVAPYAGLTLTATTVGGGCSGSGETLCLNDQRFVVSASWRTGRASGDGQAVALSGDTGYLWFFDPNNVELIVKVLNACQLNGRYWVFAGGLTNQEVVVTVTDTASGLSKTYSSPKDQPYQPLQDTGAFATCP